MTIMSTSLKFTLAAVAISAAAVLCSINSADAAGRGGRGGNWGSSPPPTRSAVTQTSGNVRDHRTQPTVRDHRSNQPIVRDHREGARRVCQTVRCR